MHRLFNVQPFAWTSQPCVSAKTKLVFAAGFACGAPAQRQLRHLAAPPPTCCRILRRPLLQREGKRVFKMRPFAAPKVSSHVFTGILQKFLRLGHPHSGSGSLLASLRHPAFCVLPPPLVLCCPLLHGDKTSGLMYGLLHF